MIVNLVWLGLVVAGVFVGIIQGSPEVLTKAVTDSSKGAVDMVVALAGIMAFWTGIMRIAEASGLVRAMARLLAPVVRLAFPGVPGDHPAMGAMLLNISANILGVGSAATPFGLQAMGELQKLNPNPDAASPAMCTFLAINTTCITLVPTTVIALRALNNSANPAEIVATTLGATLASTVVGLGADWLFRRRLDRGLRSGNGRA